MLVSPHCDMLHRTTRELGVGLALFFAVPWLVPGCGGDEATVRGPGGDGDAAGGAGSSSSDGGTAGSESGVGSGATSGAGPGNGSAGSEGGSGDGSTPPPPDGSTPIGSEVSDEEGQAWIFDEAEVHTYALTLDPEVWAALQLNARDEQYAEADLSVGGQAFARVGLRFKGSLGTLASCFDENGTPRCAKMSMKIKADEYDPEQRLFGLKRLNFNSMLYDDSMMHERIAYRVFRDVGVVAPRSGHARLVINGEDWGVFSLVEDVDGRFTQSRFESGDNNLYKEAWPSNVDADILERSLETNEDIADHSALLQLQSELLAATPDDLPVVLERYVDVDLMLAYVAVDQTLVNWDGITAFYCNGGFCENHNYYLYQEGLEPRFTLIPWDLDNTFNTVSPLTGVPTLFEPVDDCAVEYEAMGRLVMAPACDPVLQGLVSTGGARYVSALDRLLDGPLAPGVIEGWIDVLQAQLEPHAASDARGPGIDAFRSEVERLRQAVDTLRERARADRDTHL